LAGLLLSTVGVALTILLAIIEKASYGLLGGIIPMSMGIGLLAFYVIKRSEPAAGREQDRKGSHPVSHNG
jgi:uncharacterized membrane protein (GlpM family)